MKLIAINSAAYTATDGLLDMTITADLEDGNGEQSLPYGWQKGDPHGLGPQVDAWMGKNSIVVSPYLEPPQEKEPVEVSAVDKLANFLRANPDVAELIKD